MDNLKKVALVSTFCDTPEKMDVLRNNIRTIKSWDVDVICISPFLLDTDVMKDCSYFLLTKDNPVLYWPTKAIQYWIKVFLPKRTVTMSVAFPDYGYAGLHQVKQLSQLALNLDYDRFYHIIYDIKIEDVVYEAFQNDLTNSIYGSVRDDSTWNAGLHLMVFDKKNLEKLISEINLNNYLVNKYNDAFSWLNLVVQKYNFKIEKKFISDHIRYQTKYNFYNLSPLPFFKIFILKNFESNINVSLYFYEVTKTNVKIYVDDKMISEYISDDTLIDLGFNVNEIHKVHIEYENISYDLTDMINELKHSYIEFN